jgi:hypothetical protein
MKSVSGASQFCYKRTT